MIPLWLHLALHAGVPGVILAALAFVGLVVFLDWLAGPLTERFEVILNGWRPRVARIWYRPREIVLRDGAPWCVIDWWRSEGKYPVTWVYVLSLDEDNPQGEWVVLGALDPGPSWRELEAQGT